MDIREEFIKEKGYSYFNNTVLNEYSIWLEKKITDNYQALQLQQTGVIRSAFAVIPDAEKLGIGNNKITAVFKHKHQAEAWARSMWKNVYIIEQVRSEHFL